MKKILRFPLVWIFFLFLFGYMIFDISQYNKTFSELENREYDLGRIGLLLHYLLFTTINFPRNMKVISMINLSCGISGLA